MLNLLITIAYNHFKMVQKVAKFYDAATIRKEVEELYVDLLMERLIFEVDSLERGHDFSQDKGQRRIGREENPF